MSAPSPNTSPGLVPSASSALTPSSALAPQKLGVGTGIASVFRGMGFVVTRPGLWPYAMVPIVVCGVLLTVLGSVGVLGTNAVTSGLAQKEGVVVAAVWALRVLMWLVSVLLAFLFATALAQPLSGFALDALSQRQEKELGGPAREGPPFFSALAASLKVTFLGLFVGIPLLVMLAGISFLFPPAAVVTVPLKLVVVGLLAAWDFLDYPFSLRKLGLGERLTFMSDHFGAVLAFGVTIAILLLVPGVGLFLLPIGVVAGTRLVVQTERPIP